MLVKLARLIGWAVRLIARHPLAASVLALAGVIWLAIAMFSLGILDPLTRHDNPSYFHSEP